MPISPDDSPHNPAGGNAVAPHAVPGAPASMESAQNTGEPEHWGWTRTHQISIGGLAFICLIFLVVQFIHRPVYWNGRVTIMHGPDSVPPLQRTIDPNTAGYASLLRLPGIGPARAAAVVAWRTQYHKLHPDSPAFQTLSDLHHIRGFGPATLRRLAAYLRFPPHAAPPSSPGHPFTDNAGQR